MLPPAKPSNVNAYTLKPSIEFTEYNIIYIYTVYTRFRSHCGKSRPIMRCRVYVYTHIVLNYMTTPFHQRLRRAPVSSTNSTTTISLQNCMMSSDFKDLLRFLGISGGLAHFKVVQDLLNISSQRRQNQRPGGQVALTMPVTGGRKGLNATAE